MFSFTQNIIAQNTIEKGTDILQLGVGFSPYSYGPYDVGVSPTFSLGYQRGIAKLGPGTLTLGLIGAIRTSSYDGYYHGNGRGYWKQRWTDFTVGPRAEWHYNFDVKKLDLYLGLTLAMRFQSYSYEWLDNNYTYDNYGRDYGRTSVVVGPHFGMAYYLSNSVGLFGELGYTINWLTLGVNFKF